MQLLEGPEPDSDGEYEAHDPRYDPTGAERQMLDTPELDFATLRFTVPVRVRRRRGSGWGMKRVEVPVSVSLSSIALPEGAGPEQAAQTVARALYRALRAEWPS